MQVIRLSSASESISGKKKTIYQVGFSSYKTTNHVPCCLFHVSMPSRVHLGYVCGAWCCRDVIARILESKWCHYPSARASLKGETDAKRKHCFTAEMMERLKTFNPKPYAYSIQLLPIAYETCVRATMKVFQKHDYARLTPLVREVFGEEMDVRPTPLMAPETKAPVPRNRRKRPADPEYKGRTRVVSRKPSRSVRSVVAPMYRDSFSSDSASSPDNNNVLEVEDILLEALHCFHGTFWYLCRWKGFPLADSSWVVEAHLNPALLSWWKTERLQRYPDCIDDSLYYIPVHHVGQPPRAIDWQSEHDDGLDQKHSRNSQSSAATLGDEGDHEGETIEDERRGDCGLEYLLDRGHGEPRVWLGWRLIPLSIRKVWRRSHL
jgi:hypothetical protein